MAHKLNENEIKEKLSEFDGWELEDGRITRKFKFKNFAQSLEFVNAVGAIAEAQNHHPDIKFGWGNAQVFYITHDVDGISAKDFAAVEAIEKLSAA